MEEEGDDDSPTPEESTNILELLAALERENEEVLGDDEAVKSANKNATGRRKVGASVTKRKPVIPKEPSAAAKKTVTRKRPDAVIPTAVNKRQKTTSQVGVQQSAVVSSESHSPAPDLLSMLSFLETESDLILSGAETEKEGE
jgi:hypothetical protein